MAVKTATNESKPGLKINQRKDVITKSMPATRKKSFTSQILGPSVSP
jgi:hypothetical protein